MSGSPARLLGLHHPPPAQSVAAAGIGEQVHALALAAYDPMIGLELHDAAVDGCITKAPCGGDCAGPSPVDRRKGDLKRPVATEDHGIPLAPHRRRRQPARLPAAGPHAGGGTAPAGPHPARRPYRGGRRRHRRSSSYQPSRPPMDGLANHRRPTHRRRGSPAPGPAGLGEPVLNPGASGSGRTPARR
jgi:hypothetical protein